MQSEEKKKKGEEKRGEKNLFSAIPLSSIAEGEERKEEKTDGFLLMAVVFLHVSPLQKKKKEKKEGKRGVHHPYYTKKKKRRKKGKGGERPKSHSKGARELIPATPVTATQGRKERERREGPAEHPFHGKEGEKERGRGMLVLPFSLHHPKERKGRKEKRKRGEACKMDACARTGRI